ncbi:MAG: flagellar basal-body MS-ring/collar protein FliF [Pseudomonadota bacterium]
MDSISAFWNGQDKKRLAILGAATLVAFLAVLFLTRLATAPRMELLYANLEPSVAGEVVANLEGRGVVHDVRGGSIYVDGALRDTLRLQLAGEGLPRDDGRGYELLDTLSGFGTTSQMFDAAYWRAREGELTRTILAGTGVKMARVHLATADASPFARDRSATASVTMQMVSGPVDSGLARAIQSLVAGAVRDLAPDDVTIIDSSTGRVVGGAAVDPEGERRDARISEMRAAVENILAARVGPGRFVVELAVETTTARETITERVLDPESRVVISTDTEERSANDRGAPAGVTVASNLPDGEASSAEQESQSAETRERVNYDFSATQRQIERVPGAIDRVTVAVLVDGLRGEETGTEADWAPRPEPELEVLQDLVASAVGYREARGDMVTVRTMQFEDVPEAPVDAGLSLPWFTGSQIVQIVTATLLAVVATVAIAAALRVLRTRAQPPLLDQSAPVAALGSNDLPTALAPPGGETATGTDIAPVLTDETPAVDGLPGASSLAALPMPVAEDDGVPTEDDPVERLRQLIADRRDETIEVLRGWVEDSPEDAR